MLDLLVLVTTCAPAVAPETMLAVIAVESSGNPHAIGIVDGRLVRQPTSRAEALSTITELEAGGWNYSVGLSQVNRANFARFDVGPEELLDPCTNVRIGAAILGQCYAQALEEHDEREQHALRAALSCYYSGTYHFGQRTDATGTSYVDRIMSKITPD